MQVNENRGKKRRHENNIIDIDSDIEVEEDRLSSLPANLLMDIISRLGIKSAVATSVLSHQWRYLWTNVDRLHLVQLPIKYNEDQFHTFCTTVNRILEQITSPKICTFHLTLPQLSYTCVSHMCSSHLGFWLRQICTLGPEEIKVIAHKDHGSLIPLPLWVLKCPSLVTLELSGRLQNSDITVDISAPNLKYLSIKSFMKYANVTILVDAPKLQAIFLDGVRLTYSSLTNPSMLHSASIGFSDFRDVFPFWRAQETQTVLLVTEFYVSIALVLQYFISLTSLRLECMSTETPFDWAVLLPVCVLSRLKKIELVKFQEESNLVVVLSLWSIF